MPVYCFKFKIQHGDHVVPSNITLILLGQGTVEVNFNEFSFSLLSTYPQVTKIPGMVM